MKTLYKKGVRGQVLIWQVEFLEDTITTYSGQEDGVMQITEKIIDEGKANRTIEEQVELRINRMIQGKLNCGYKENREDIEKSNENQLNLPRPMKAKLLKDGEQPPDSVFERAYVQRKYNGHRCLISANNGQLTAYSSGGKPITSINHILSELDLPNGVVLDGELYSHGLSLQEISSRVRKQNEEASGIRFICFDAISNLGFVGRKDIIRKTITGNYSVMAKTIRVYNFEEVARLFFKFRAQGYEGAMLRHGTKEYESGKRSNQIYKIKKLGGEGYYDEEFTVVDVKESVEGWGILVCKCYNKVFRVSAPGTHNEKRYIYKNKEKFIGKRVTVQFPERTDSGLPSQPIAIAFRGEGE